jgi:hypothetical protein
MVYLLQEYLMPRNIGPVVAYATYSIRNNSLPKFESSKKDGEISSS